MALWNLYQTCKAFGQRPSTLFGIDDPWLAWEFDHATAALGIRVEGRIEEKRKDGRPVYKSLEAALNIPREIKPKPISRSVLMMLAGEHGG
ncbi:MAG: hypothetical protein E6R03_17505 [Hyphomicrobiaceae bacterium]|jgi:hypothetical protein|nr:MAG: hypothetical protein E6R03_17505 [Hyphomicrobiaceae bacterium]